MRRTLAIMAMTALVSCSSPKVPASTPTHTITLQIHTTTASAPLIRDLTSAYREVDPAFVFETERGDYQTLLDRLAAEAIPYFLSNHLPPESLLWAAPVAQDGIAVITHPDNPVTGLTSEQLRRIYQGQITNWDELGGPTQGITVLSREAGSGTRAAFERLVMGPRRTTPTAQLVPSSAAMLASTANLPGSIGYVSMGYTDTMNARVLLIDGNAPTPDTVAANIYPLRSTVFIVGREEPEGAYRAFIGWVQSGAGQAVVGERYAPLFDEG